MTTLHQQIQTLLNQEKTQEALNVFSETSTPESELLQGRFDRLLEAKAHDKVTAEQAQIELNRIQYALLEMSQMDIEVPEYPMDLKTQFRQLISKGETEAALRLLLSTDQSKGESLLSRLKTAQIQLEKHEIDYSQWSIMLTGINQEILELNGAAPLEQFPTIQMARMDAKIPSGLLKDQILQQLQEHQLEEALELCKALGEPYLLFMAELNAVKKQFAMGLIQSEIVEQTRRRIKEGVQKILF